MLGRAIGKCKGPEAGACPVCLRSSGGQCGWREGSKGGDEATRVMRCPVDHCKDLGLCFKKGAMGGFGVHE